MVSENEFNFRLNSSSRNKREYMGNWQLQSQFQRLDSILGDTFTRNLIIGHVLPVSLFNYQPAKYVANSNLQPRDELQVYSGYLKNMNSYLHKSPESLSPLIDYLESDLLDVVDSMKSNNLPSQSSDLFNHLFLDSSFLKKKNPSNYLTDLGGVLYDKVQSIGKLSGNRVVVDRNYRMLKSLK
jgi:hypothetical protein